MRQMKSGRKQSDRESVTGAAAIVVIDERAGPRPVADQLMEIDRRTDDESRSRERASGQMAKIA